MTITRVLQLCGALDGSIAAIAAVYGATDPSHLGISLTIAGIAGGIGTILNTISHFLGGNDVVPPITKSPAN